MHTILYKVGDKTMWTAGKEEGSGEREHERVQM